MLCSRYEQFCYPLKYYEEKAVDAPYEISSIDDYFTLIEICNNYGYIPEKINLNTDLDFADYDKEVPPLCNSDGYFSSVFYGNNHTIKNIKIGSTKMN